MLCRGRLRNPQSEIEISGEVNISAEIPSEELVTSIPSFEDLPDIDTAEDIFLTEDFLKTALRSHQPELLRLTLRKAEPQQMLNAITGISQECL